MQLKYFLAAASLFAGVLAGDDDLNKINVAPNSGPAAEFLQLAKDIKLGHGRAFATNTKEIAEYFDDEDSKGKVFAVIDMRSKAEYDLNHVTNAVSLPFEGANVEEYVKHIANGGIGTTFGGENWKKAELIVFLDSDGSVAPSVAGKYAVAIKDNKDLNDQKIVIVPEGYNGMRAYVPAWKHRKHELPKGFFSDNFDGKEAAEQAEKAAKEQEKAAKKAAKASSAKFRRRWSA